MEKLIILSLVLMVHSSWSADDNMAGSGDVRPNPPSRSTAPKPAANKLPDAAEFFEPISDQEIREKRVRPGPERYSFKDVEFTIEQARSQLDGTWQVRFHCGGKPVSEKFLTKNGYGFDSDTGLVTVQYDAESGVAVRRRKRSARAEKASEPSSDIPPLIVRKYHLTKIGDNEFEISFPRTLTKEEIEKLPESLQKEIKADPRSVTTGWRSSIYTTHRIVENNQVVTRNARKFVHCESSEPDDGKDKNKDKDDDEDSGGKKRVKNRFGEDDDEDDEDNGRRKKNKNRDNVQMEIVHVPIAGA